MSTYDPLSFLDNDTAPVAPEVPAAQEQAPAAAPVAPETPAAPAAPEGNQPPSGFVPHQALHEARNEIKTLREAVENLKKSQENLGADRSPAAAAQPPAPVVLPQPGTPEFDAYVYESQVRQQLENHVANSETRFLAIHGEELTAKVQAFAQTQDEHFFSRVLRANDPYKLAYEEYQRHENAKAYGEIDQEELKAFREYKAAQAAQPAVVAPSQLAQQPQEPLQKVADAGTILSAPSAGASLKTGDTPSGPGKAFDKLFN